MSLVDLGKKLLEAAKRGDTDAVRALMSNGAPFTTDWLGTSPLHFAAQFGHIQTAEVLLRAGISRDARTKVDRTPLHVAAQEGHVDIVELLLDNSADIDAKDMLKMSPLHWATEKGHIPVVEVLLKHSADTSQENKFDRTPLDIAIANGRTDIAQLLQLAQHTEITCTEGETVTIETTPDLMGGMLGSEVKEGGNVLPVAIVPNTATTSKSKKEGGEGTDQSSTSVLATLAALAEATAPINSQNVSSSEAMNWLESQGITMISTADGGIITSAVESGQTISLTEAGKIALNLIRQQGLGQSVTTDGEVEAGIDGVVDEAGDQKVITIVTDQGDSEIPSNNGTVLVAVNPDGSTTEIPVGTQVVEESPVVETEIHEPLLKKIKTEDGVGEVILEEVTAEESEVLAAETEALGAGDAPLVMVEEGGEADPSEDRLRKQLEEVQKQAEEYRRQLEQKAEEAEGYKKKLIEIHQSPEKSTSGD